jgi:segregation and condensation protein A
MSAWTVHTDVFDGPLDLLLYLVRRDGISLLELKVVQVADAYLEYVDKMRALNLSIASDYLVMSATLVHLKSLELLPRIPTLIEQEDVEDPRESLARRLREYAAYKEAGESLVGRPVLGRDTFARDAMEPEGEGMGVRSPVDAFGLLEMYYEMLSREAPSEPVYELQGGSGLDFDGCCRYLLERLGGPGGRDELGALLLPLRLFAERVVTFVAVLEMVRLGYLIFEQQGHLSPIWLTAKVGVDADLNPLSGFLEATA